MCKKMSYPERAEVYKKAVEEAREYRDSGIAYFKGDASMTRLYREDCKQVKKVYSLFKRGKYKEACVMAEELDTAVRDGVNDVVWKEIHGERN